MSTEQAGTKKTVLKKAKVNHLSNIVAFLLICSFLYLCLGPNAPKEGKGHYVSSKQQYEEYDFKGTWLGKWFNGKQRYKSSVSSSAPKSRKRSGGHRSYSEYKASQ